MRIFRETICAQGTLRQGLLIRFIHILLLGSVCIFLQAQDTPLEALRAIGSVPAKTFEIDASGWTIPPGGHFQGIQLHPDEKHLIISASSDEMAYAYVVEIDAQKIVSIFRFMRSPMDHAGGIQLAGNLLAVGVEDNDKRDTSVLLVYDVEVPFLWSERREFRFDRFGSPGKATAGAVAFQAMEAGKYRMAVANWDALDIRYFEYDENGKMRSNSLEKGEGVDKAYQNLNFYGDYLLGFYKDGFRNCIDVLELEGNQLTLLETLKYRTTDANFRHAAGIGMLRGKPAVFSTDGLKVSVFR